MTPITLGIPVPSQEPVTNKSTLRCAIMAEAITEGTAKLQLDEETGEMVSKNELKKRMQKRAKKAATAAP